jgi:hypothetical protein
VEHVVRERFGQFGSAQVGTTDGAHHQRAAGEERHRCAAVLEKVRVVVRGMTGRGDRPQDDAGGEHDPVLVGHGAMWRLEV